MLFLVGLVLEELIRLPVQMRQRQSRKAKRVLVDALPASNTALDSLAFAGLEIVPAVYVLTPWLDFADYPLPVWIRWLGVIIFVFALWLLWQAHAALDQQWSATLAIQVDHQLIQHGVYQAIRHPIYAALWLTALAQACLLPNWIAGFAGLLCFLPFYWVRAPQEEASLLAHFGETYQNYMAQTGRVLPHFRKSFSNNVTQG